MVLEYVWRKQNKNEKYGQQYGKNMFKEYMKEYLKEYRNNNPGMCWRIIRKRYLLLPEISDYNFRDTTTMSFLTKDEEVLLKYNKVWSKIKSVKKINLLVTQSLVTNIWRPERSHEIAKSPQIVMVK